MAKETAVGEKRYGLVAKSSSRLLKMRIGDWDQVKEAWVVD